MKIFAKAPLVLLIFTLLLSLGIYAYPFLNSITIDGKIVDSITGEPIKDARITSKTFRDSFCSRYIFDCGYKQNTNVAISREDGRFSLRIPKIPPALLYIENMWIGDMQVTSGDYISFEKRFIGKLKEQYVIGLKKKYIKNLPQGTITVTQPKAPKRIYLNLTRGEIVTTIDDADIILEYDFADVSEEIIFREYIVAVRSFQYGKRIYLTHIYSNKKGGLVPIEESHLRKFEEINDCSKAKYEQDIDLFHTREKYGLKNGTRIFCFRSSDEEHFAKILIEASKISYLYKKKMNIEIYDNIHFVYQPHGNDLGTVITEPSIKAAMKGRFNE